MSSKDQKVVGIHQLIDSVQCCSNFCHVHHHRSSLVDFSPHFTFSHAQASHPLPRGVTDLTIFTSSKGFLILLLIFLSTFYQLTNGADLHTAETRHPCGASTTWTGIFDAFAAAKDAACPGRFATTSALTILAWALVTHCFSLLRVHMCALEG